MSEHRALRELTWTRVVLFLREPEAVFWTFAFPILLAFALGIAFRNQAPAPERIGVAAGPAANGWADWIDASPDLVAVPLAAAEADRAFERGEVTGLVRAGAGGGR